MKSLKPLFSVCIVLALLTWTANPSQAAIYSLQAILDGLQETSPNATPATGVGLFMYDDVTNSLSYDISYAGLLAPEVAAHIHTAPPGVAGPVTFPLPPGNPKIGAILGFTAAQEVSLLAGDMYVNIHTQQFPGGEIRGQISVIPEPSTFALGGIAVAGLLLMRRCRAANR